MRHPMLVPRLTSWSLFGCGSAGWSSAVSGEFQPQRWSFGCAVDSDSNYNVGVGVVRRCLDAESQLHVGVGVAGRVPGGLVVSVALSAVRSVGERRLMLLPPRCPR